jgi:hypothetical protein
MVVLGKLCPPNTIYLPITTANPKEPYYRQVCQADNNKGPKVVKNVSRQQAGFYIESHQANDKKGLKGIKKVSRR